MKKYPSIESNCILAGKVWAFDKLDGSNIRAEWSNKRREFYKFGSRLQLIDDNTPMLGKSIKLIKEKYEVALSSRFKERDYESVVCFFEFFGPNSFAGQHVESDVHDVVLFDIAPYKKGVLHPDKFIELTKDLDTPRIIHVGYMDDEFLNAVKNSSLQGISFEGVVCKNELGMAKVKTFAWLDALKKKCGNDERLFKSLS